MNELKLLVKKQKHLSPDFLTCYLCSSLQVDLYTNEYSYIQGMVKILSFLWTNVPIPLFLFLFIGYSYKRINHLHFLYVLVIFFGF